MNLLNDYNFAVNCLNIGENRTSFDLNDVIPELWLRWNGYLYVNCRRGR
jgi:hypothetical protein